MRIGFIPGALDTLSGEHFPHLIHMRENIRALSKKAEVNVLTADKVNALYLAFQSSGFYERLSHRNMHILRKILHFLFFLMVYLEVRRNINCGKNELFLVRHSFSSNYLIARYLRSKGYKILLEVHALAQVEEKHHGQTYLPECCSYFYFLLVNYLEKKMLGWADRITTVSESLKKSLVDLGVEEKKIHAVHNAVEPDKFLSIADAEELIKKYNLDRNIVVGFVGSFARYHGVEILLDVAERLEKKFENIVFLLVGRNVHGPDNPMENVFTGRFSSVFVFAGEVPHSMIPQHIAAMDIAIVPDFNDYGSPMKLFEYMAMKKAVVAPDVAPIREVVEDGQTALLFERGQADEAARCIERLIEDENLRHAMGRKAHREVMTFHTWDQNAGRIVDIAESMIE